MLPPRPPSPPSGPPLGLYLNRANELAPDPPVPAITRTTARSMNIGHRAPAVPHAPPQLLDLLPLIEAQQWIDHRQHALDLGEGRPGVERPPEVGMQLPRRLQHRRLRHGAQLPAQQIEPGPRHGPPVPFGDHPGVERRVQPPDTLPQLPVVLAVHDRTGLLAPPGPLGHPRVIGAFIARGRR